MSAALQQDDLLRQQQQKKADSAATAKKGSTDPTQDAAKAQASQGNNPAMVTSSDRGTSQSGAQVQQQSGGNSGVNGLALEGDDLGAALQSYKRLVRLSKTVAEGEAALKKAKGEDQAVLQRRLDQARALYARYGGDEGQAQQLKVISGLKGDGYAKAFETLCAGGASMGWTWDAASVDKEKQSYTTASASGSYKKEPGKEAETKTETKREEGSQVTSAGIGASGSLLGASGSGSAELVQGRYADITAEYGLLEGSAKAEGKAELDKTGLEELQKIIEKIRAAKTLWEVIGVVSKINPKKLTQFGASASADIEAAITAARGKVKIDGAPLPFSLGSESMLLEWLIEISAAAYAKVWVKGDASADVQKLQLGASGSAGAKAVIEAGASLWTRAVHVSGDTPGAVAEGMVEAKGSAGASAEAHFNMQVGKDVIEISAGAGVTWGLGGSISGKLRVSIVNGIKLVAAILGATERTLPEPLAKIWASIESDGAKIRDLIDLKDWVLKQNPLAFIAKYFSAEQVKNVLVSIITGGLKEVSFVKWLEKQVQLGEEGSDSVTIGTITFTDPIVYWLVKCGIEVLKLLEWGAMELLGQATEIGATLLLWLIKGGKFVVELAIKAWGEVGKLLAQLAERYPKSAEWLQQAGEKSLAFLQALGKMTVEMVGRVMDLVQQAGAFVIELIAENKGNIQAVIRFITSASERVWGWIKAGGKAVGQAFMTCGQWLVDVAEVIGDEIVAILREVSPGLVKLGAALPAAVVEGVKKVGGDLLRLLARHGLEFAKALGDLGGALNVFLLNVQKVAKAVGTVIWEDLTLLYEKYGKRAIEFLRTIDGLGGDALHRLYLYLKDHADPWKKLITTAFEDLVKILKENKEILQKGVDGLIEVISAAIEFGAWILKLSSNLLGPSIQVLREYGPVYAEMAKEIGVPFLKFVQLVGKTVMDKLIADVQNLKQALLWVGAKLEPLAKKLGELTAKAIGIIAKIGLKAVDLVMTYGAKFIDWAEGLGEVLWGWISKAGAAVLKVAISLGKGFLELYNELKDPFLRLLEKCGELIGKIYTTYRNEVLIPSLRLTLQAGEWVLRGVAKYGAKFLTWAGKVGAAVWEGLKAAAEPVVEVAFWAGERVVELFKAGKDVFLRVAGACHDALRAVYTKTAELVAPAIQAIGKAGTWLAQHIAKYGKKAIDVALEATAEVLSWMQSAGAVVVEFVMEVGSAGLEFVRKNVGEPLKKLLVSAKDAALALWKAYGAPALEKVMEAGRVVGEWLWGSLKTLGAKAYVFCRDVAVRFADALKVAGKKVWDLIAGAGEKVWAALTKLGQTFIDWVREYGPKIITWATESIESLTTIAGQAGADVLRMILSGPPAAWQFAKQFPARIVGYSRTLGDTFRGLMQGLAGVWGWLTGDDEACKIVESGAYHILDASSRGKLIGQMLEGRVPGREESAILRLMRYSVEVGDLRTVLAVARGSAEAAANAILWAFQGSSDDQARTIFTAQGISW